MDTTPLFVSAHPLRLHSAPATNSFRCRRTTVKAAVEVPRPREARTILSDLMKFNESFSVGNPISPNISPNLRVDLATNGQAPGAAILACADSRVTPEHIFGAGLGEVFVIRNAGNVAWGDSVVGSLEFAIDVLGVPLVMVLGHTKCGAIGAAVQDGGGTGPLQNHVQRIREIVGGMEPNAAVERNVRYGVQRLTQGDCGVSKAAKEGRITVIGAVYDMDTGRVKVIQD